MEKTKYKSDLIGNILSNIPKVDTQIVSVKMGLAANLEDMLNDRKISKKQLAEALNKRPSEITKWLSGTHNFTIDTLVLIADYFETTVERLFLNTWFDEIIDEKEFDSHIVESEIYSVEYWENSIKSDLEYNVSKYLKKNKLNQADLAKKLGCTESYLSKILTKKIDHKLSTIINVCLAINKAPVIDFKDISELNINKEQIVNCEELLDSNSDGHEINHLVQKSNDFFAFAQELPSEFSIAA